MDVAEALLVDDLTRVLAAQSAGSPHMVLLVPRGGLHSMLFRSHAHALVPVGARVEQNSVYRADGLKVSCLTPSDPIPDGDFDIVLRGWTDGGLYDPSGVLPWLKRAINRLS
jgi:hypothetical protein